MNQTTKTRRVGRKRWTDLVRFLTTTMKTSASERVRMQAAERLTDILTLREQRDQLELRRDLRLASKAEDGATQTDATTDQPIVQETPEQKAERFLASINQRTHNEQ